MRIFWAHPPPCDQGGAKMIGTSVHMTAFDDPIASVYRAVTVTLSSNHDISMTSDDEGPPNFQANFRAAVKNCSRAKPTRACGSPIRGPQLSPMTRERGFQNSFGAEMHVCCRPCTSTERLHTLPTRQWRQFRASLGASTQNPAFRTVCRPPTRNLVVQNNTCLVRAPLAFSPMSGQLAGQHIPKESPNACLAPAFSQPRNR